MNWEGLRVVEGLQKSAVCSTRILLVNSLGMEAESEERPEQVC